MRGLTSHSVPLNSTWSSTHSQPHNLALFSQRVSLTSWPQHSVPSTPTWPYSVSQPVKSHNLALHSAPSTQSFIGSFNLGQSQKSMFLTTSKREHFANCIEHWPHGVVVFKVPLSYRSFSQLFLSAFQFLVKKWVKDVVKCFKSKIKKFYAGPSSWWSFWKKWSWLSESWFVVETRAKNGKLYPPSIYTTQLITYMAYFVTWEE